MAKKLKAESLLELEFISDPQLSPDGKRIAAVHTAITSPEDSPENKEKAPGYRSRIYLYDQKGEALAFTQGHKTDSSPRFSPDGKFLAFLSQREDDKTQLFVMPLAGGEAKKLTDFKSGVSEFCWHPESQSLAFVSRGDWQDEAGEKGQGRIIERMFYKINGTGFKPSEVAQIYLFDLNKNKSKKLSKLKSDPSELVFSPDGTVLYFSAAKNSKDEDVWKSNLWRLPLKGGKAQALVENLEQAFTPSPSPDGKQLAFFAHKEQDNFASPVGLWLVASEGGEAQLLSGDLDAVHSAGGDSQYGALPNTAQWSPDSRYVYVAINRQGRGQLSRLEPSTGRIRALYKGDHVVSSFHHQSGFFAFILETPAQPGELYLRDRRGRVSQLSKVNEDFVKKYALAEPGQAQYARAKRGPRLNYWQLEPSKARKDKAMVLQVHGGPHTNYGYGFYFEFQLLAAAGYTVVYGNPRGSSSYGQNFATAILGGYGTVDADDILSIAHSARQNHVKTDAPMHLTGGSYGGFMTNWLLGQTDEFKSAVTQRGISNWLSFYGSSDIGYRFSDLEVAGNPWEQTELLWQQSPLKYVANISTPLLIIHAEEDHRCPIEQAEQLYIALKSLGKAPTKFLRFPAENHELSRSGRPDRRIQRLQAILDWFEDYA